MAEDGPGRTKKDRLELSTAKTKFRELERLQKRRERAAQNRYEELNTSLIVLQKSIDTYAKILVRQQLDATTGICNMCGGVVSEEDAMYRMEKCGAVWGRFNLVSVSTLTVFTACVRDLFHRVWREVSSSSVLRISESKTPLWTILLPLRRS